MCVDGQLKDVLVVVLEVAVFQIIGGGVVKMTLKLLKVVLLQTTLEILLKFKEGRMHSKLWG